MKYTLINELKKKAYGQDVINSRQMLLDTFQYIISKVAPGIAGLIMVMLFVRSVGVDEYGRYSLIFYIVSTVGTLAVGWLNQAQLRYYSKYEKDLTNYMDAVRTGTGLAIGILLLIVFFIAIVNIVLNKSYLNWSSFFSVVFCIFFMIYTTLTTSFQSQISPHLVVKLEIVRSILSVILPLVLIWVIGANHLALLVGITLAYAIAVLQSNYWHKPEVEQGNQRPRHLEDRRFLLHIFWSYGWPMSLWLGSMAMFSVVDRYFIQHFYSFEQTGSYASLYDLIVRSFSLLFFPITLATHPRIMAAWNSEQHVKALSIIRWTLLTQIALFIPLIVFCALIMPRLMGVLLPNVDLSMSKLILPLAVGGFLWQMSLVVHKPLEITENSRLMLLAISGALLINIFVNYWGLPRYGVIVAAYSSISSATFYMLICLFFYFVYGLGKDG